MSYINKDATLAAIANKAKEELADANHYFLEGVQLAVDVVMGMPDAQPKRKRGKGEEMSDLIDRKAAIDAICKSDCGSGFCGVPCQEVNALEALPSAQPEIIRCRECKCWRELPNGCQGFCDVHSAYPTVTDFCSWAERREVSE